MDKESIKISLKGVLWRFKTVQAAPKNRPEKHVVLNFEGTLFFKAAFQKTMLTLKGVYTNPVKTESSNFNFLAATLNRVE